jgi:glycosyltransferase involved in cell wall biosynthesis
MTRPLVTVIVTVHARVRFLGEALRSVAAQTFTDFDVLVADDSGSRAAAPAAGQFAGDQRFRYVDNQHTLGIASSLRHALGMAAGEYIAILNDDDLWEPEFLSRLVPVLEADDRRVLAFADHWVIREDGEIDRTATEKTTDKYGRRELPEGEVPDPSRFVIEKNGVPLAMASLFRASALNRDRLVPEVAGAYDWWISLLLAASGGRFYYVPARLTRYRVHPQMETARRSAGKGECTIFILRSLIEADCFPALRSHLQDRLAASVVRVGRDRLYFDQPSGARAMFVSAFRLSPGWRPAAAYCLSFLPRPVRKAMGVSRA